MAMTLAQIKAKHERMTIPNDEGHIGDLIRRQMHDKHIEQHKKVEEAMQQMHAQTMKENLAKDPGILDKALNAIRGVAK